MKQICQMALLMACVALGPAPATSAPLCAEFQSPDLMPKKYRKLAPVISGRSGDWILTRDQMKSGYSLDEEALNLLREVVEAFEARDMKLAILMPPPRPILAGQKTIDRLNGAPVDYDVRAVKADFDKMVKQARSAGVLMPNLLRLALKDPDLRRNYYFRHDTHWTPEGAAMSALALAKDVAASKRDLGFPEAALTTPQTLPNGPVMKEKGSLAQMAEVVCGAKIDPVTVSVPLFPSNDGDLLEEAAELPKVILAGSSFSNRYKRDAYNVADALAGALGAEVFNHSVSGGGALKGMEAALASGQLDGQGIRMVVWELPYTQRLSSTAMLRDLLDLLQVDAKS